MSAIKAESARRNLLLAQAANAARCQFGVWKCATCSKEAPATVHQLRKTYCSKDCMAQGYASRMVGSANPNFRGAGAKVCQACGGDYVSHNPARKFCSAACYQSTRPAKPKPEPKPPRVRKVKEKKRKPRLEKACLQCETSFKYSPSQDAKRYCSYACHLASGGAFRAGIASSKAKMRYGVKKDANHNEIFDALRKLCAVYDLSALGHGVPDGLAWVGGKWHLFDVKNPKTTYGRKGMNTVQKKWLGQWKGGPVYLLYTVDEALRFGAGKLDGLKSISPEEALVAVGAMHD